MYVTYRLIYTYYFTVSVLVPKVYYKARCNDFFTTLFLLWHVSRCPEIYLRKLIYDLPVLSFSVLIYLL
jgi:hypothetical protein